MRKVKKKKGKSYLKARRLSDEQVRSHLYDIGFDGMAVYQKMLLEKLSPKVLKEIGIRLDEKGGKDFGKRLKKELKLGKTLKDASMPSYVLHNQLLRSRIKEFKPGERILVSKCRWAYLGKKLNLGDYCCDPCVVYHNNVVKAFDKRFGIRFPRMLPKGDAVCEIVFVNEKE